MVASLKDAETRTRPAEVETARLRLRAFTLEDLEDLSRIAGDAEVMRHIGGGLPFTRDETLFNLTNIVNAFRRRGYGRWALEKKDGGGLIGYCGLAHGSDEIGVELVYLLAREEWGKGVATEAASATLRYGFESLGFDSIAAVTRPTRYHGYSCVCYTLTRDEWRAPEGAIYRVR
jgi:RimJ/RimL family protein N-acetyltransferase